jgi:hypothetical protein
LNFFHRKIGFYESKTNAKDKKWLGTVFYFEILTSQAKSDKKKNRFADFFYGRKLVFKDWKFRQQKRTEKRFETFFGFENVFEIWTGNQKSAEKFYRFAHFWKLKLLFWKLGIYSKKSGRIRLRKRNNTQRYV